MKTTSFIPFIFVLSSDDLGRLKTEINMEDGDQKTQFVDGQKIEYTYGNSGDIVKREYYNVQRRQNYLSEPINPVRTDSFGYTNSNWKNQCDSTNINGVSSALTYDAIGNPLNYRDGMQMTWQNGRQLKKLTAPNGKMLQFSYDLNGQRQAKIERSYGNVIHTTKYFYDGTKLAGEKKDDTIVWYDYDENGAPVGMRVNGLDYIFRKNLQGDITGIYDSYAQLIVEYTYADAWGAGVTVSGSQASTIGMYNSFRYRGYYYDTESGLYYLNSRYYDPVACRFINADGLVSTGRENAGYNMYSYCGNNPVNYTDPSGLLENWEKLGFKYDGSMADFRRLERGLPPLAYDNWLKNGGTKVINRETYNNYGVKKSVRSVTLVPKDRAKDFYIESSSGSSGITYGSASFFVGALTTAKNLPIISYLLLGSDAIVLLNEIHNELDSEKYKKVMSSGEDILIVVWDIGGARCNPTTIVDISSWNEKEALPFE